MGFLSGLFSDKKTTKSNSSQTGEQSYGLTPEVKSYWESISPQYTQGWNPVADNQYQTAAAQAQAGYASGLNPAFGTAVGIGQTGIDPNLIAKFQSPYQKQVIDSTIGTIRDNAAITGAQQEASAAKMGALGGTGGINRRLIRDQGTDDLIASTTANLSNQGFNTALGAANQSTQAQLAGLGAASGIAGQQSNINQGQFGMGTGLWGQGWQNAVMPYTIGQQGAGVLSGLAGASGQSTSGTANGTQTMTGTPSLFSVGSNLLGAAFAGGWQPFSDARVKERIVPIGESFDGQPIYKFNYKGDPRTTIGLMAQDVEEHTPEAVGEVGGVKTVDYDRALADAEARPGRSEGGAVGAPRGESDPHAKFKSAFEAITGLISKARGGSVGAPSGLTPPGRSAGGPIGSWSTTVTPASLSSFDVKKFGQGLSKMGEPSGGGEHDTSLLQQQQQSLAGMLSGMGARRAAGGGVWDETGPEFGGSSGMAPMRLGAAPDPVDRRELPPARPGPVSGDPLLGAIKKFEGYNPRSSWDYKQHSVGYGTRARHPGEVIDKDEAERRLADEVAKARGIVERFAPNLDPGTKAALTSLTYNAGDDWTRAGLGSAIRSGNMDEARRRFVQYNKAGGETLPGLVNRRQAEVAWMGGEGPSGASAPVRVASAEGATAPTSASPTVATDAPKRGGWFSDGVWAGEKMTPMQRLGVGLMSVRGPMFGGPMNDMAKQLMAMEEGRLNEKRVDSQADQFAKQIAQQAAIAAGMVNGQPTVEARRADAAIAENDSNRRLREANVTGVYDGQPTVAGRTAESGLQTAELQREAAQLKLDEARNPNQVYERRAAVADKYGLTGDQRTQFIFDGKIPDKSASTETTETKEVTKAAVENAQKDIVAAQAAKDSMKWVDQLYGIAADPGIESAVGPLDQYSMFQSVAGAVGAGNPELHAKILRIQKQLELAGGQEMKGLGAQSETDAKRLQEAVSNLTSARNKKEFMDSLAIIEDKVSSAYNRGVSAAKRFPGISPDLSKSPTRDLAIRAEARKAIEDAKRENKDIRQQVIERLIGAGVDPTGI